MITNSGKKIISKYLLGQTAEYAGYIAVGCGTNALTPSQTLSAGKTLDIKSKTNLDFEMFRVPISSRGYVVENGESKQRSIESKANVAPDADKEAKIAARLARFGPMDQDVKKEGK